MVFGAYDSYPLSISQFFLNCILERITDSPIWEILQDYHDSSNRTSSEMKNWSYLKSEKKDIFLKSIVSLPLHGQPRLSRTTYSAKTFPWTKKASGDLFSPLKKEKVLVLQQILVPKSIPYACTDFQKSTVIHMDIHDFFISVFNYSCKCGYSVISKQGYPSKDILRWMSMKHEYPLLWISVFKYPCFYWYSFGHPLISTDIHAWTYGFSIQRK